RFRSKPHPLRLLPFPNLYDLWTASFHKSSVRQATIFSCKEISSFTFYPSPEIQGAVPSALTLQGHAHDQLSGSSGFRKIAPEVSHGCRPGRPHAGRSGLLGARLASPL